MSYIRIWIHCVWATKNHTAFLTPETKPIIINHIKETAKAKDIYLDFINRDKNHLHCIISLNPKQNIADIMQQIKGESSFWINKNKIIAERFVWADEYFAVSVSESGINNVREYIKNQEQHHKNKTWEQEYNEFISIYGFKKMNG
jgi:REP element-mobilizing transposase RayT